MKTAANRGIISAFGVAQLIMVAALSSALWLAYTPWRWARIKESFRTKYPAVAVIGAATLQTWLETSSVEQPLIFDVRSDAEYAASHLPGARRASPSATPLELGMEGNQDVPLVFYCAVGADSTAIAQSFLSRGFQRVQILDGGIFQWAQDGRALQGTAAPRVLTGQGIYANLLPRALRAR